uniref:Uncharacterized protein n=1 Tax=Arundo donax TaxID=35708 RepID=A0A0A8ZE32_ARUDO
MNCVISAAMQQGKTGLSAPKDLEHTTKPSLTIH